MDQIRAEKAFTECVPLAEKYMSPSDLGYVMKEKGENETHIAESYETSDPSGVKMNRDELQMAKDTFNLGIKKLESNKSPDGVIAKAWLTGDLGLAEMSRANSGDTDEKNAEIHFKQARDLWHSCKPSDQKDYALFDLLSAYSNLLECEDRKSDPEYGKVQKEISEISRRHPEIQK
jgi:hypothetical protein